MEILADEVKECMNYRMDAGKLKIAKKSSKIIANTTAAIIVALVLGFFIVFASMGTAYAISGWIGKTYAGFLIVAAVYLLTAIFGWKMRKRIIRIPVINFLAERLFIF